MKKLVNWFTEQTFSCIELMVYGFLILNLAPGAFTLLYIILAMLLTHFLGNWLWNWANNKE